MTSAQALNFFSYGLSDIGTSRSRNEDTWSSSSVRGYHMVADGLGGRPAGEVASKQLVHTLSDKLCKLPTHKDQSPEKFLEQIKKKIDETNHEIFTLAQENEYLSGMGSTLCLLYFFQKLLIQVHVGDSRAYRLRNSSLELLTKDHTQSSKDHTGKVIHKLTRAVGLNPHISPSFNIHDTFSNDLYLICTDGLSHFLSHERIEEILLSPTPQEYKTEELIEEAKRAGSRDNITAVIIETLNEEDALSP